jgi:undecaprenyl-diphosphatase
MVTPLLVLAAVLWARKERWERAATAVVAYLASKAIIFAGWNSWDRDRPADVAGGELVPADLASFPSGHSVQVWTVYGLLILWWAASTDRVWERTLAWTLLLAGSIIIGVGRVAIGAHYPSDILGGMVLGGLWLAGAAWAERAVRSR